MPQGTYSCKICPRTFTTKGSMHRHERNHDQINPFTCSVCEVSFRRRDLLTRHLGIHDSNGENILGRQRTRKACNACRQARTKCSGEVPCDRCQQKDISCRFTMSSARTSCDTRSGSCYLQLAMSDSSTDDSEHPEMLSNMDNDPSPLINDGAVFEDPSAHPALNADLHGGDDQLTPNSVAWPWMHEYLFLSEDLNLDWYDFQFNHRAADTTAIAEDRLQRPNADVNVADPQHQAHDMSAARSQVQENIIDNLVNLACEFDLQDEFSNQRSVIFYEKLPEMVDKIKDTFELDILRSDDFHGYINLYLDHFWPLWSLSPRQHFANHTFEPILYLAMVSIGSMYGNRKSSSFGIALHNRLRDELIQPSLQIDLPERLMLPVGQARSLTQAAALYFGHQKAFTYASLLGGTLISQARKMNLFATTRLAPRNADDTARWVKSWINRECKIRLSFAILRLEMYTSALFMTRPLVSGYEMDIALPCSKYIWTTEFPNFDTFAAAIEQDRQTTRQPFVFSDLLNVLIDPEEQLPHIDVLSAELLVNAMQEEVWSASTSRSRYSRLAPSTSMKFDPGLAEVPDISAQAPIELSTHISLDAHLAHNMNMRSLLDRVNKTTSALRKLKQYILRHYRSCGLQIVAADRSSIFTCLLAYHLSFLQLYAPVASIQQACHHLPNKDVDQNSQLLEWALTEDAQTAAKHAVHIFHLLKSETLKHVSERARVNFLTLLGLYHSATVLYAYAIFNATETSIDHPSTDDFVTIFRELNPAWAARSSFSNMLQTLR